MDMVINYGKNICEITYEALEAFKAHTYIPKNVKISIKPNLVNSLHPSKGSTTHPEVVDAIIQYLHDYGHFNIEIIESSWVGDATEKAFKVTGYHELANKYGIELIDLKKDQKIEMEYDGIVVDVCKKALDAEFIINVPVLKAHSTTKLTCCLKNLKGCIPDKDKRHFHTIGLHKPIAALAAILNKKVGLCVVDGICGDLTFEEGGTPVQSDMIVVGKDPVLIDSFAANFLGLEIEDINYLELASQHNLGKFYSADSNVLVLNKDKKPVLAERDKSIIPNIARFIKEDQACSSCYAMAVRALFRAGASKEEFKYDKILHIGQGYKGVEGEGVGIGNCTSGFEACVKGCPPRASEIMKALGWRE